MEIKRVGTRPSAKGTAEWFALVVVCGVKEAAADHVWVH